MRSATTLDVLHAVTCVARAHAEVEAWWYAPPLRLRLAGERAPEDEGQAPELAVVAAPGQAIDGELLARELGALLGVPSVRVRPHRGTAEPRALFRLVTTRRDS